MALCDTRPRQKWTVWGLHWRTVLVSRAPLTRTMTVAMTVLAFLLEPPPPRCFSEQESVSSCGSARQRDMGCINAPGFFLLYYYSRGRFCDKKRRPCHGGPWCFACVLVPPHRHHISSTLVCVVAIWGMWRWIPGPDLGVSAAVPSLRTSCPHQWKRNTRCGHLPCRHLPIDPAIASLHRPRPSSTLPCHCSHCSQVHPRRRFYTQAR